MMVVVDGGLTRREPSGFGRVIAAESRDWLGGLWVLILSSISSPLACCGTIIEYETNGLHRDDSS